MVTAGWSRRGPTPEGPSVQFSLKIFVMFVGSSDHDMMKGFVPSSATIVKISQISWRDNMSVRESVKTFVALGRLPNEKNASEDLLKQHNALLAITKPVTDEEANLLITCFGEDDCFGLAW